MLRFEVIENTKERVSYRYFPENQEQSGVISVKKSDKTIVEQTIASNDEFKWCFFKLFKRIKEYIDADQYESSGIIAWY